MAVPMYNPPKPVSLKSPPNSKPPIPCKMLDVVSKPLTYAGNLAIWGVLWGPVRILHPLWQGKDAFLKLP
jgi:hypothetical protein